MKDTHRQIERCLVDILQSVFYGLPRVTMMELLSVQDAPTRTNTRFNYERDQLASTRPLELIYHSTAIAAIFRAPKKRLMLYQIEPKGKPNTYMAAKTLERIMYYKFSEITLERGERQWLTAAGGQDPRRTHSQRFYATYRSTIGGGTSTGDMLEDVMFVDEASTVPMPSPEQAINDAPF